MRIRTSFALLLALIVACSGNGIAPWGSLKTAVLHYTAMSGLGIPLVAGSLRLVVQDDSIVTGTWSIIGSPAPIPPRASVRRSAAARSRASSSRTARCT